MNAYEIQTMLDKGLYVDTGRKPGFDRHHLVFYSQKDDCCFVAIRDESSGAVVTVLPLAYQENLAWPVSAEDEGHARRLATRAQSARSFHLKAASKKRKKRVFRVSVQYMDCQGDRHIKSLANFDSRAYCGDHKLLFRDATVLEQIDRELATLGMDTKAILTVYVRLGADEVAEIDLGL